MASIYASHSVYKIVAILEILLSIVIFAFGVFVSILFHQQDEDFQKGKDNVQYAGALAVIESALTILISVYLIIFGKHKLIRCNNTGPHRALHDVDEKPRPLVMVKANFLPPKIWLIYSLLHLSMLLYILIAPWNYCLQNNEDASSIDNLRRSLGEEATIMDWRGQKVPIPPCYSMSDDLIGLRQSFRELYTYVLVSILTKPLFIWLIYKTVKYQGKKHREGKLYRKQIEKISIIMRGEVVRDEDLPDDEDEDEENGKGVKS